MSILEVFKSILTATKEIDTKKLPSLGIFYNDDFKISIKKADIQDIIEYETDFKENDLGLFIHKIKSVVRNNVILSKKYTFNDIKSLDLLFIFFEIVSYTKNQDIEIPFKDNITKEEKTAKFNSDNFNYFNINENLMGFYNKEEKVFEIEGYKYSASSIGVEDDLSVYLTAKMNKDNIEEYKNISYHFVNFLGQKNSLTSDEIENLIEIFNYDLNKEELKKIRKIIDIFEPMISYTLKQDQNIVKFGPHIDLENIFK